MHKYFMLAALEQAWLGRGVCAPNPSVGAIAVCEGEIIAQAYHHGAGAAHAEQLLLEQIYSVKENTTLYVTLEPCNHWGRTAPCVEAIIACGIKRVIYGLSDPNPIVAANNTPKILREKGIEVIHFPLEEIAQFYKSYCYWTQTKKPWVTVKLAQTLDGKIAGKKGLRRQLSNVQCAEFTHIQRLHADAILTTAATIEKDDPLLNVRIEGKRRSKPVAIIDSRLSLNSKAKVLQTASHCHIYHHPQHVPQQAYANCSYHCVPANKELLDLRSIINHLGNIGYHDLWVEAGGSLFSALHRENLVQRTYLYIVPEILGEATPAFQGEAAIFTRKPLISWQVKADNAIACLDWQEDLCLPA